MPRLAWHLSALDGLQAHWAARASLRDSVAATRPAAERPPARAQPERRQCGSLAPESLLGRLNRLHRQLKTAPEGLSARSRPLGHHNLRIGAAAGPGVGEGHCPRWSSYRNCNICRWCPSSPPVRRRCAAAACGGPSWLALPGLHAVHSWAMLFSRLLRCAAAGCLCCWSRCCNCSALLPPPPVAVCRRHSQRPLGTG